MIAIMAVAGLVTVQDGGRPGRMHEGLPPGGALVPEQLARANAGVHNGPGEPAIEIVGAVTVVVQGDAVVASEEGDAVSLRDGEAWTVTCAGARVRYLAVRGGIDVPRVLGGRGTLVVAGLGGHQGRPLRKGDVLRVGDAREHDGPRVPLPDLGIRIGVVLGPDGARFAPAAIDLLLGSDFVVSSRSDRVGTRLVGPALSRVDDDAALSAPMVRGAIQVPASGEPIVLGPDHPTTGGYPVIATVVRAHLGSLLGRPVGARVRFTTALESVQV